MYYLFRIRSLETSTSDIQFPLIPRQNLYFFHSSGSISFVSLLKFQKRKIVFFSFPVHINLPRVRLSRDMIISSSWIVRFTCPTPTLQSSSKTFAFTHAWSALQALPLISTFFIHSVIPSNPMYPYFSGNVLGSDVRISVELAFPLSESS